MKKRRGRPTLEKNHESHYVAIGSIAMTDEQATMFEKLAASLHGKANAVRYIIDVVLGKQRRDKKDDSTAA